ncbi:MAG: hypothetical protein GY841_15585 [FCB group bacterium]|nr:hypothetical protein [FCB group bacterium]
MSKQKKLDNESSKAILDAMGYTVERCDKCKYFLGCDGDSADDKPSRCTILTIFYIEVEHDGSGHCRNFEPNDDSQSTRAIMVI